MKKTCKLVNILSSLVKKLFPVHIFLFLKMFCCKFVHLYIDTLDMGNFIEVQKILIGFRNSFLDYYYIICRFYKPGPLGHPDRQGHSLEQRRFLLLQTAIQKRFPKHSIIKQSDIKGKKINLRNNLQK